jgi:hypothetical protein
MRDLNWINAKWFRIVQHLAFWTLSYVVLLNIFRSGPELHKVDYIYAALFHLFLIPPVYLNLFSFVHQLNRRFGWLLYALKISIAIALFSWLSYSFFQDWSADIFPDYYFISYYTWLELALFIFIYITITSLIKGTRSWFTLVKVRAELQEIEKEKAEIELKALKSQVNPHFLFNTLNGIYSMTLTQDQRLPATVLQLSELMRYFLYESTGERVPLEKEVALLRNYIALQKIRLGDRPVVRLNIQGTLKDQQIAPLLLITFVENAFKHGDKQVKEENLLDIDMQVVGNSLNFTVTNRKGQIDDIETGEFGGIGLENVKRRLELIYPGKHELMIQEQPEHFKIELKLQLHETELHHH